MARNFTLVKRKGDSQLTTDLIDAYELLNDNGKHWIKTMWYYRRKEENGEVTVCRCLMGGVNAVAKQGSRRWGDMVEILYDNVPEKHWKDRFQGKIDFTGWTRKDRTQVCNGSLQGYNDTFRTEWKDIKQLFIDSVKASRKIKAEKRAA